MLRKLKTIIQKIKRKGRRLVNRLINMLSFISKKLRACLKKLSKILAGRINPNLILFDSPFYGDNAKVLSDYILKNKPNYKIIYLIERNQKVQSHERVKYIRRSYRVGAKEDAPYSLSAYYYATKAKYIFYTHSFEWAGKRNENQLIINLWHGTGYKGSRTIREENVFDFMLVPGDVFIKSKALYYGCEENRILTLGYPRYDLYCENNFEKVDTFLKSLSMDLRKNKIVLWLPTFFSDVDLLVYDDPLPYIYSGLPLIATLQQILDLDKFCGENNIKLIIKKHNFKHAWTPLDGDVDQLKNISILSDVGFKNFKVELYELLPLTSGLISDFSSVAVDYLLLEKPLAYVVKDLKNYEKTRGFVFDDPLIYMPGYHVYTLDHLSAFIFDVAQGVDKYQKLREEKMPLMHNKTDNYSKRIVDYFNL